MVAIACAEASTDNSEMGAGSDTYQRDLEIVSNKKQYLDAAGAATVDRVDKDVEATCINAIRWLGAMLPFQAKSGHPGAPMGCAPIAYALWGYAMNYASDDPAWWNRDRFVLSNGHACALQYVMLYLCGYEYALADLQRFRQRKSITPGHPESHNVGIEVTTGPLGQGIANAVGLSIAAANMAATYNKPGFQLFDSYTYVLCGDGCLQEGIASEAASLAGTMNLGNLILIYDDNGITIDGKTDLSFKEDVCKRFEAYGWDVTYIADGDNDVCSILGAIGRAKLIKDKPSLIKVRTTIGYGSLLQGSHKTHGSPLSADDMQQIRNQFHLEGDNFWDVPQVARDFYVKASNRGRENARRWKEMFASYSTMHPEECAELRRRFARELPIGWQDMLPKYTDKSPADATRNLSEIALNAVDKFLPDMMGGSADLMESNKTHVKTWQNFNNVTAPKEKYLRFGVREHAMVATCNGLFAFGAHRPFGATFLNFYTYAWGAVRLAAISHFGNLFIASHDSIELGEDGPTHQPIETIALCRATPNLLLIRPCDGNEVSGSYAAWLTNATRPSVVCLSRGKVPHVQGTSVEGVMRGAYTIKEYHPACPMPKCILAASGTELGVAMKTCEILRAGFNVKVVSMPCWELFEEQDTEYQDSILPRRQKRPGDLVAVAYMEASSPFGFQKYFDQEASHGITTFGQSAPAAHNMEDYGFTAEAWASKISNFAGVVLP